MAICALICVGQHHPVTCKRSKVLKQKTQTKCSSKASHKIFSPIYKPVTLKMSIVNSPFLILGMYNINILHTASAN